MLTQQHRDYKYDFPTYVKKKTQPKWPEFISKLKANCLNVNLGASSLRETNRKIKQRNIPRNECVTYVVLTVNYTNSKFIFMCCGPIKMIEFFHSVGRWISCSTPDCMKRYVVFLCFHYNIETKRESSVVFSHRS